MKAPNHVIETKRLLLRPWQPSDLEAFSKMHADPDVMADQGGPISAQESQIKLQRYISAFQSHGYARWCVTNRQGRFVGYVGINHHDAHDWLGAHDEIGWRLTKNDWGQGFATEAAIAAIEDSHDRLKLKCVLSCTSLNNVRSQSVMKRIGMSRCPAFDFSWKTDVGSEIPVLVWRTGPSKT